MYGEGPIHIRLARARQIVNNNNNTPKPPAGATRASPLPSGLPFRGRNARQRRADFARSARRFLAQYAPIVRAPRAQYARLRRVWVQKKPRRSARLFLCGWVDLPSGLKNGLQTPPDCPQIGLQTRHYSLNLAKVVLTTLKPHYHFVPIRLRPDER